MINRLSLSCEEPQASPSMPKHDTKWKWCRREREGEKVIPENGNNHNNHSNNQRELDAT